jgi:hypothetical protein
MMRTALKLEFEQKKTGTHLSAPRFEFQLGLFRTDQYFLRARKPRDSPPRESLGRPDENPPRAAPPLLEFEAFEVALEVLPELLPEEFELLGR